MAKTKIRVVSYVWVGEKLVETSQLTPEQRLKMATELKIRYLNTLCSGRIEFRPEPEESRNNE